MKKRSFIIFASLVLSIFILGFIIKFMTINRDIFTFMNDDERFPTAREVLNEDSDADIISLDERIYERDDDWEIKANYDVREEAQEIGEIKRQTTNVWWFPDFSATKLEKGTKIYINEMQQYRRGDKPGELMIKTEDDLVFYRKVVKHDDAE